MLFQQNNRNKLCYRKWGLTIYYCSVSFQSYSITLAKSCEKASGMCFVLCKQSSRFSIFIINSSKEMSKHVVHCSVNKHLLIHLLPSKTQKYVNKLGDYFFVDLPFKVSACTAIISVCFPYTTAFSMLNMQ